MTDKTGFEMKILLLAVLIASAPLFSGCDGSSRSGSTCKPGETAACACPGGGAGIRQCTDRGIWSAMCESCGGSEGDDTPIPMDCQADETRACPCPGDETQNGVQTCAGGFWSPCTLCPAPRNPPQPVDSPQDLGQRCAQDSDCQSQKCIRHTQGEQVALSGYCYKKCQASADCQISAGPRLDCLELPGTGKTCVYGCGGTSGTYNCRGGDTCLALTETASACFFPATSKCFNGASRCIAGDAGAIEVCLSGAYQKGRCDGIGGNACLDNRCTAVAWHNLADGNLCFGSDSTGNIVPIGCAMKPWNTVRLDDGGKWIFIDTYNRCLEVKDGLAKDGAALVVNDCTNAAQQLFLLNFADAKNAMELQSILQPASAKFCIDYHAPRDDSPGTYVYAWSCWQGDNQYWRTWAQ